MPSLRELQLGFAEAVLGAQASTAWLREPAAERLEVYRNTVRANYRNALAATYRVTQQLVGAPFFNATVDAFVLAHPSRSGDLNDHGAEFAAYLATYAPARDLSYLPDVARLEWAIDEAGRAPDFMPDPDAVLAALAVAPAERLAVARIRLAPSCRLVSSPYPILRIWQVNQPDFEGDPNVSLDMGGDSLRIRREPQGRVGIERLADGLHAWLTALAADATLGAALDAAQAADPRFDLGDALRGTIADGSVAGVVTD